MATTVGEIIREALLEIEVLAAGEPLPALDGKDALKRFQKMVDYWSTQTWTIPVVSVITHTLVNNVPDYTIGIYPAPVPVPLPDNHIETARPMKIVSAFIRDQTGTDYPIEMMSVETFDRISRKSNASRPSRMYVREGWPLNTMIFESVPYADETLHLSAIQPLAGILPTAKMDDIVDLPPGYELALIMNLAQSCHRQWSKPYDADLDRQAKETLKWVKRNNSRPLVLSCDRAVANRRKGLGTYIIDQGP